MADNQLEVVLSAKTEQYQKDIAAAGKALQNFDKTAKSAKGLDQLSKSAANATPALTNFGRVIQDAPFGLIGIANNIDPLIESFGRLKTETGSTGGALKALGASLLGPAGLAFGVSAVTSLLIAFGPQIKAAFSNVDKEAEAAAKAAKDLADAIDGFGNASSAAAGKEKALVDSLIAGTQNLNLSQKQRLFYVDELQKKFPEYFGNLSKEQILAGNTGDAYDRLSKSILAAAKARAAQDVLSKIAAQQIALDEQRAKVAEETQKRIANAQTGSRTITGGGIAPTSTTVTVTREEKIAQAQAGQAAQLAKIDSQYKELNKQAQFYSQFVTDGAAATADLEQKVLKTGKTSIESLDKQRQVLNELYASGFTGLEGLTNQVDRQGNEFLQLADAIAKAGAAQEKKNLADKAAALIAATSGTQKAPADIAKNAQLPAAITAVQQENALKQIDLINQLKTATDNTNAAFNLLGGAIDQAFNALANGENPIQAVGQAVKQLVVQLIKAVIQAAILSAILNAIAPGSSAASGGFSGIFKGLLGFRANGGPVNSGGPYIVGENGPELFVPSSAGQVVPNMALAGGSGQLSARISGNDLLFILNNASRNRNTNFG